MQTGDCQGLWDRGMGAKLMVKGFYFGMMEMFWNYIQVMLHNIVNVLNVTGLLI